MGLENYEYSATELLDWVRVPHPVEHLDHDCRPIPKAISVGMALNHIAELGNVNDLKGDCDGIDALCYHLCKSDVNHAIEVLQRVNERLDELERNRLDKLEKA